MRMQNKLFWICMTGTIFLAAGIIFLPRYFSRGLDMRKMDQVQLVERKNFFFVEQSPDSILENARALRYLNQDEKNLMLISSYDESAKINQELLQAVYEEAMRASRNVGNVFGFYSFMESLYVMGMFQNDQLPPENWKDEIRFARYYSLLYDTDTDGNTREMLNFWYLRFSDGDTFDYYFVVNAANYQIYYVEIHNWYTDQIVKYWETMYGTAGEEITVGEVEEETALYDDFGAGNKAVSWNEAYGMVGEDSYQIFNELVLNGCLAYYQADSFRDIRTSGNKKNRMLLMVLNYGTEALYIEQLAMPETTFPYRGISIGLQNMEENVREFMTQ